MAHRIGHGTQEEFEGEAADRFARRSRWLGGMHRRTAERAASWVPPGGRMLDVGCGPGTVLAQVVALRQDAYVTGVDVSRRMVELATARVVATARDGHATVVHGDVEALPFPDGSADVVTAVLTAHHWEHLDRAFAEVARVLAPGGSVLVVEMRSTAARVADALRQALGSSGGEVRRSSVWAAGLPLLVRLSARSDGRPG